MAHMACSSRLAVGKAGGTNCDCAGRYIHTYRLMLAFGTISSRRFPELCAYGNNSSEARLPSKIPTDKHAW